MKQKSDYINILCSSERCQTSTFAGCYGSNFIYYRWLLTLARKNKNFLTFSSDDLLLVAKEVKKYLKSQQPVYCIAGKITYD
jgi:hypothetical protein